MPNKSPEPMPFGAGRWRSQRGHDMVEPNMKIAAQTVIAVPPAFPPSLRYGAASLFGATSAVHAASRGRLSFFR